MPSNTAIRLAIADAEADGNWAAAEQLRGMLVENAKAGQVDARQTADAESPLTLRGIAGSYASGGTLGWADEARGVLGAAFDVAGGLSPVSDALRSYRLHRDDARREQAQFAADHPVADTAARLTGGLVTVAALPASTVGVGSYGAMAKGGALLGGVAGLGESDAPEYLSNAVDAGLGAATGALASVAVPLAVQQGVNAAKAIGSAARRGARYAGSRLGILSSSAAQTPPIAGTTLIDDYANLYQSSQSTMAPATGAEHARLVSRADDLGIVLPPGARHNNDTLRRFDAALSSNPITARPFDAARQNNAEVITDLVAQRIGLPAGTREISPAMLGAAVDDIGRGLDDIGKQIPWTTFDKARDELNRIMTRATDPVMPLPVIKAAVKRLQKAHDFNAGMNGERLMQLRSMYNTAASDAWRAGNSAEAEAYEALVDMLDGIAERASGSTQIGKQYAALRKQWSFIKKVEKAGVFNEGKSLISPLSLRRVYARDPAYLRGRDISASGVGDDLADALRVSQMGKDIVGDSGTATRLGWLSMLRNHPIETVSTMAATPVVSAYVRGGPVTSGVAHSLLTQPGAIATASQRGVLASGDIVESRRRRKRR